MTYNFTRAATVQMADFSKYFYSDEKVLANFSFNFTFLCLPISYPIWQYTPLPKLVQFPWRFLSLTVFCVAVLASRLPEKK